MKEVLGVISVCIKYLLVPENLDWAKFDRYYRVIMNIDDRGVINCLYRETKSYCICMQDKKLEADDMAKLERCLGCQHSFSRDGMTKCSGWEFVLFCTKDCQKKHWPAHK